MLRLREKLYQVTDTSFELPELNRALLKWELVYDTVRPSQARDYLTQKVSANVTYAPRLRPQGHYISPHSTRVIPVKFLSSYLLEVQQKPLDL